MREPLAQRPSHQVFVVNDENVGPAHGSRCLWGIFRSPCGRFPAITVDLRRYEVVEQQVGRRGRGTRFAVVHWRHHAKGANDVIPPRTILAATDFSGPSIAALVCAARLARHCQAALHVVHAEDPLLAAAAGHTGMNLAAQTREELQRVIAATRPAADCSPQVHVVTGSAVDVILDVARAQHADLIVVGSRGMSGAEKLMFGSITEGILRRSDVSVLVVPPQWMPPRPAGVDLAGMGPLIAGVDMSDSSLASARAACRLASALGTAVEVVHVVPDLAVLARCTWSL